MQTVVENKKNRKRRSDFGAVQTTERDLFILRWIGEMYAVQLDHVRLLGALKSENNDVVRAGNLSDSAVKNLYRRWIRAGWVEKQKLLVGQPQWLWLTRKGLHHVGLDYPYREPSVTRLNHIHQVNAVRFYVAHKLGDAAQWVSERDINQARKEAGKKHLVDGAVIYKGTKIAVEVELNRKSQRRLASILRELKRDYEAVWYFTADECHRTVKTAVARLPNHEKTFVLYRLADVIRRE